MMEFIVDWNSVCLICLQEGEMRSIYEMDTEDQEIRLSDKIMRCSDIVIKLGMNMPEQICNSCTEDLSAAYRFRNNCESSNVILRSLVESPEDKISADNSQETNKGAGEVKVFKYIPPAGLNVRKIKTSAVDVKIEEINMEDTAESEIFSEHHLCEETYLELTDDENDDETTKSNTENEKFTVEYFPVRTITVSTEDEISDDGETLLSPLKIENLTQKDRNNKMKNHSGYETGEERKSGGRPKNVYSKDLVASINPDNVEELIQKLTTKVVQNGAKPSIKSRDENRSKVCEICGNSYKYQHALDVHMRRHENNRPFSCEFCEKSFVAAVELRRHMRVHTGQKPYGCHFCSRKFSDFGSRIKHERTHTGERPYSCETCGKSFTYAHVLSVHILTHTGQKKFRCQHCEKGFTKKVYLTSHIKKFHMNLSYVGENLVAPAEFEKSHNEIQT